MRDYYRYGKKERQNVPYTYIRIYGTMINILNIRTFPSLLFFNRAKERISRISIYRLSNITTRSLSLRDLLCMQNAHTHVNCPEYSLLYNYAALRLATTIYTQYSTSCVIVMAQGIYRASRYRSLACGASSLASSTLFFPYIEISCRVFTIFPAGERTKKGPAG